MTSPGYNTGGTMPDPFSKGPPQELKAAGRPLTAGEDLRQRTIKMAEVYGLSAGEFGRRADLFWDSLTEFSKARMIIVPASQDVDRVSRALGFSQPPPNFQRLYSVFIELATQAAETNTSIESFLVLGTLNKKNRKESQ